MLVPSLVVIVLISGLPALFEPAYSLQ